ncbi:MAG TPA: right-handed parallel beta-helix repeat-containing protein [bacterium]|nr:right-handed parallel beta-helix repeat-containing protein [bacterium]
MTRLFGCLGVCWLLLSLSAFGAYAAEYDVNQDGTGDFEAIQDAIDVTLDGYVIIVHPGTYYENIHFDGKNITLRSLDPEDEEIVALTIIDGAQKGSVVTFAGTEDETCLLSGFTIANGTFGYGGGIYGAGTFAGVSNCTISGNSAEYCGGALHKCSGTISDCTISGNSAGYGGGLYDCDGTISSCTISGNSAGYDGGGLHKCSGTISDCTISGNSAEYGGGLAGCNGTISNCTITGNSAVWVGGGLHQCYATVTDCTISDNAAQDIGGGLSECHGTISECTISGNSAPSVGGLDCCSGVIRNCTITGNSSGGLMGCDGSISNCTITGNSATGEYARGGGLDFCSGVIRNCTITGNSAEYGGGLHQCYATVTDCIIWGNDAPNGGDLWDCGSATITYSCVGVWFGGGEGNISDNPLFVSGPLGDYYLSCRAAGQDADSPCIDTGSGTAESLGLDKLTTRTDSVPDTGVVDMGYHYPLTLEQNPQIVCSLNESEFAPGETLVGFIEAQNPGPDVAVDAYVAFVLPNGTIISLTSSGLAIGTYPWVSNVVLPSGFDFGPTEVLRTTVPQSPGDYLFAAALTNPGQLAFIGDPCLFPFTITD